MDCVDLEMAGAGAASPGVLEPLIAGEAYDTRIAASGGRVVAMPARFRIIEGGRPERPSGTEAPKLWLCRTCEDDIGVATSIVEPVWQGPMREQGRVRLSSGTKRIVCTHCKMRGKLVFAD